MPPRPEAVRAPGWQARIARTIAEAESAFASKHMIAQNIANGSAKIDRRIPEVSLFNFHYATPPVVIAMNAGLKAAIGDDETGFKGTGDRHYRVEAWEFLLAGGAGGLGSRRDRLVLPSIGPYSRFQCRSRRG